jgi:2-polyprenyl-6-methoxyphenol hydroxylase-like FAD-dependent oxidoreductase
MAGQGREAGYDTDVLVVGGGPVGLLLGTELALGGVGVTVLERLDGIDPTLKAGGLNLTSAEILDRRGFWPAVERLTAETRAQFEEFRSKTLRERGPGAEADGKQPGFRPAGHFAGIMLDAGRIDLDDPELVGRNFHRTPLLIRQQQVEQLLGERAAELGVDVRRGVSVESVEQDADGVTAECADGTRLRARWLVGCDGGRSQVRKQTGFDFPGTDPEITAYQAVLEMTGTEALLPAWNATDTGVYSYGPIPGRIVVVSFAGVPADRDAPITEQELQDAIRYVTGVEVNVHGISVATRFTDNARQSSTYRQGRVLLAGDAAHVNSPFGGQGLNLGFGDAMNLGWKLAAVCRGEVDAWLLDTYTAERHPIGAWVMDWTRAQISIMRPDPYARAMRSITEGFAGTVDGTTYLVKRISGVWQRYDLGGGHPLTGASAPDTLFADGTHLADHLHAGKALLVDPAKAYAATVAGYEDRLTVLTQPVEGPESAAAVLVRPDGYIAWAAGPEVDDEGLAAALRAWLGAPAEHARA